MWKWCSVRWGAASDQLKLNQKLNNRISVTVLPTTLRLSSSRSMALVFLCNDDNKHKLIWHSANVAELKVITTLNDEFGFMKLHLLGEKNSTEISFEMRQNADQQKTSSNNVPTQILLYNWSKFGNESNSIRIRIVAASLLLFDKRPPHTQTHAQQHGFSLSITET